ncbi:MAG TPA: hypothetical protein VND24_10390, partial [Steroidobacteraceae bacterium]|nr:hypothetical protein [Steroidobacteraceae bacterium]
AAAYGRSEGRDAAGNAAAVTLHETLSRTLPGPAERRIDGTWRIDDTANTADKCVALILRL